MFCLNFHNRGQRFWLICLVFLNLIRWQDSKFTSLNHCFWRSNSLSKILIKDLFKSKPLSVHLLNYQILRFNRLRHRNPNRYSKCSKLLKKRKKSIQLKSKVRAPDWHSLQRLQMNKPLITSLKINIVRVLSLSKLKKKLQQH